MFAHRQIGGISVTSTQQNTISEAVPLDSRILNQLKVDFGMTRSLQREFHEVLIDPGTVSLSKDNRGLRNVFKRSGLNHRNLDHWKYLLAVLAEALYPPTSRAAALRTERKKKWIIETERAFFLEVAKIYIETGKAIPYICADLKGLAAGQSVSLYRTPSVEALKNKFSMLLTAAKKSLCSTQKEPWLGIDQGELRSLLKKIADQRREQRKRRSQKRKS
jgi:hypothetical protein